MTQRPSRYRSGTCAPEQELGEQRRATRRSGCRRTPRRSAPRSATGRPSRRSDPPGSPPRRATSERTPGGSNRAIDTRAPATKPNAAPISAPRSSATATTKIEDEVGVGAEDADVGAPRPSAAAWPRRAATNRRPISTATCGPSTGFSMAGTRWAIRAPPSRDRACGSRRRASRRCSGRARRPAGRRPRPGRWGCPS